MSLKSTDLISNIENVSKTKIRGVLALLKHGELLTTQGNNKYFTELLFKIFFFYIHNHDYNLFITFNVNLF